MAGEAEREESCSLSPVQRSSALWHEAASIAYRSLGLWLRTGSKYYASPWKPGFRKERPEVPVDFFQALRSQEPGRGGNQGLRNTAGQRAGIGQEMDPHVCADGQQAAERVQPQDEKLMSSDERQF